MSKTLYRVGKIQTQTLRNGGSATGLAKKPPIYRVWSDWSRCSRWASGFTGSAAWLPVDAGRLLTNCMRVSTSLSSHRTLHLNNRVQHQPMLRIRILNTFVRLIATENCWFENRRAWVRLFANLHKLEGRFPGISQCPAWEAQVRRE